MTPNHRMALTTLAGFFGAALTLGQTAEPRTTWTIAVDCDAGQSVSEALAQTAPVLTVQITGLCQEAVEIRRDNVRLMGSDPRRDGIGVPPGSESESALTLRSAANISIEGLRLADATRQGLRVLDSTERIEVRNVLLEGNGLWGVAIEDSSLTLSDTIITGNGALAVEVLGGGLIAARNSEVLCRRCSIEQNPAAGVNLGAVAFSGSTLRLEDSRVEASTALLSQSHARAVAERTELSGAVWAFQANIYGTVRISDAPFSGPFLATGYSTVELLGATQVLNTLQNFVADSSTLIAERLPESQADTALSGLTLVADNSTGRLDAGSAIEELVCGLGGDVSCFANSLLVNARGCDSCSR